MKKIGTLILKRVKGGLKLDAKQLFYLYSTLGISPNIALGHLKELLIELHKEELEVIDEEIKNFEK